MPIPGIDWLMAPPELAWLDLLVRGIIVVLLVILSSRPVPPRVRRVCTYVAPPILLAGAYVSPGAFHWVSAFPGGEAFLGYYLFIAFGLGFGLHLVRLGQPPSVIYGSVVSLIFGSAVVVELVTKPRGALNRFLGGYRLYESIGLTLACFWIVGGWALWRLGKRCIRVRRARDGLCEQCAYDLRGNPDAASCPECGHPVAQRTSPRGGIAED